MNNCDVFNFVIWVKNGENIKEKSPLDRNKMFLLAMSDFLEAIKFHRKPRSTISDGINSIEIVQSIKRSSSSGLVEKIS